MSNASPSDRLDFHHRWNGVELMDDPACDERLLRRTLGQFRLMNRLVSRYRHVLSRWVLRDMQRAPERAYHLVDVGAGGCDIALWLMAAARRRGLTLRITALDNDPRAVAFARERAGHIAGLDIRRGDLAALAVCGEVDYVFSNHVMHHLPDPVVYETMRLMHRVADRCWMASDLQRSPWAYAGFQLLGRFFRDSFTFEDGKRSIRRGFTAAEWQAGLAGAGLATETRVETLRPGRVLAVGSRRAGIIDGYGLR